MATEVKKELSAEDVLINCLASADRIKEIVITIYTKDGWYETWSNDLPSHVRLGLLRENIVRVEKAMAETSDEEDTEI